MATVDFSTLTNILQKDIDPMLRTLHITANKSPLCRMWKEGRNGGEGTSEAANNTFYISVKYAPAANVASQAEGATLRYGRSYEDQMSFSPKYLTGAFTISLQSLKGSDSKAATLVNKMLDQSQGLLTRAQIQMARQANNDGTGKLALVNDATPNSKSTVTIDTVRGQHIKHFIQPGDSLRAGTSSEQTSAGGTDLTVTSVDSATQFSCSETTASMADNDLIYFADSHNGTIYTEKMGVDGLLISSGTLQGLSVSTRAHLLANIDTTSEAIGESRVLQYLSTANAAVVDGSAFIITLGNDLWYKMVVALKGTAYTQNNARLGELFVGGAGDLQVQWFGGNAPIVMDPFCVPGQVYGIDLHNVGYKQLYPLSLVDDGQGMSHRVTQKLEYEVAASEGGNFYIIDPQSCFKLTNKS